MTERPPRVPKTVGKCTEMVNGKVCDGDIKERIEFKERSPIGRLILGEYNLVGFECQSCKNFRSVMDLGPYGPPF